MTKLLLLPTDGNLIVDSIQFQSTISDSQLSNVMLTTNFEYRCYHYLAHKKSKA